MGLSISQTIVNAHGGEMKVSNNWGGGAALKKELRRLLILAHYLLCIGTSSFIINILVK
jgi:signal transduction histidine kinase